MPQEVYAYYCDNNYKHPKYECPKLDILKNKLTNKHKNNLETPLLNVYFYVPGISCRNIAILDTDVSVQGAQWEIHSISSSTLSIM